MVSGDRPERTVIGRHRLTDELVEVRYREGCSAEAIGPLPRGNRAGPSHMNGTPTRVPEVGGVCSVGVLNEPVALEGELWDRSRGNGMDGPRYGLWPNNGIYRDGDRIRAPKIDLTHLVRAIQELPRFLPKARQTVAVESKLIQ